MVLSFMRQKMIFYFSISFGKKYNITDETKADKIIVQAQAISGGDIFYSLPGTRPQAGTEWIIDWILLP